MPNPTAAMIVIGDEILSGRTRDANLNTLARALTVIGIDLIEARVVGDRHQAITGAVRELARLHDHVFTSGGIGPTHDDITATCVAEVLDRDIGVREDARAILKDHYDRRGIEMTDARLQMARVPAGATLIENPVSAAPGFTIENVHVMAGIPRIFDAMLASLLPRLTGGKPLLTRQVRCDRGEGDVAEVLHAIADSFPDVSLGSYPFEQKGRYGTNLVLRSSDPSRLDCAARRLEAELARLGE